LYCQVPSGAGHLLTDIPEVVEEVKRFLVAQAV
jgi:hypothetical protein